MLRRAAWALLPLLAARTLALPLAAARTLDLYGREGKLYANGQELRIKVDSIATAPPRARPLPD